MRSIILIGSNISAFLIVTLVLVAAQVSLWLQLFGFFPPPNSWIPTVAFLVIYRSTREGAILTIFLTAAVSTLTASPFLLFTATNLLVYLFARFIKHRIYWTGPTYFMGLCAILSTLFPITYLLLSWVWERSPVTDFAFFETILRALLTALLALPTYYLFLFIDTKTNKKLPTDSGNLLYE